MQLHPISAMHSHMQLTCHNAMQVCYDTHTHTHTVLADVSEAERHPPFTRRPSVQRRVSNVTLDRTASAAHATDLRVSRLINRSSQSIRAGCGFVFDLFIAGSRQRVTMHLRERNPTPNRPTAKAQASI